MGRDGYEVVNLTEDDLAKIIEEAVGRGIEAYQDKNSGKNYEMLRVRRMREMLQSYRRVKKRLDDEPEYTQEEKYQYRLQFIEDLMGDPFSKKADRTERILVDRERKRKSDFYTVQQIEEALNLYEQECQKGTEEDARRYRELRLTYIDGDTKMSVADIAIKESVSEKTVYRDLNIACEAMYQYAIGM